ncbi:retention module-containing protein [Photobacterium toruni]|uniref:retention module-containing protein n=1 Tax=Photobacterium toruni TaxID=1935446 RepID=UPI0021109BE6|nr:retention module-containing protein [Photobacterium toruni]
MVKNDNKVEAFKLVDGESFILQPNQQPIPVIDTHPLQMDEIIVNNRNTQFIVIKDGIEQIVNLPCSSCTVLTPTGVQTVELDNRLTFNGEAKEGASFSADDITALQNAILAGQDPTALFEAPAAGNESATGNIGLNGTSATASFITINYNNDAVLAKAGFDTTYDPQRNNQAIDPNIILAADGGESGAMTIVEGDLSPQADEQGYPVQSSISIAVEAATLPLDTASFVFDPLAVNSLLSELNNEITAGGEAVSFIYDIQTNSIVGSLNGETIMLISLSAESENGRDVSVNITTTINQPIDHVGGNNSNLVSHDGDIITVDVSIQGADSNGNLLDKPINVDITIKDGANPEFGTDSGTTINETTQGGTVITGEVPLDVGSDAIHQLDFNADQPNLANLTSNGTATTFTVNGNVLTVVDSHDKPVMLVTIAKDGSYTVEVTGPIDQNDANIANINLGVTATDNDGDTANGQVVITINDGADAGGNEYGEITITEGDLTPQTGEQGYPVSGTTTIVIEAGADRLDPTKVTIDPKQLTSLITELESELTTGDNQAISFSYDSATGQLVGVTADGEQVVTVSLNAVQAANGHDIDVTVTINQQKPLNHTDSGVDGLVDSVNDKITIDVPIQAQDTDGDWLDNPANVDITIVDGANPEFGTDSGTTIDETTQNGTVITGDVPLDVGSDAIHQLDFNADQPDLANLTSNGAATTFTVNGNVLTVVDSHDKPVMVVTIAKDGSYTVEVTGPIDQNDANIANINLGVTATDNDGDTANGQVVITINDGADAGGNEYGEITLTEGDLTPQAGEQGYPVSGNTTIVIEAGADRLDPSKVTIDPVQLTKLISELESELTTGDNQAISFSYDSATGQLVGVTADGEQVVTVSLDAVQAANGHDIDVTVTINQDKPLNHTDSGVDGLVDSVNDKITIDVPIQVQDTDGDWLDNPANVDITIKDGANPEFGTDSGTTIDETTQSGTVITGDVPLDVGSDAIHQLDFNADQPDLANLTSNGAATTFTVNGNVLTVVDSHDKPVMVVTIAKDGSYTVEVTGPIDQNDANIANINLGVTATDNDGDTANGQVVITINDGADAGGNEYGEITLTEGDLTPQAGEQGYPVSGNTTIVIEAGADRLDPSKVTIDPVQLTKLINELELELTTGDNQAISFSYDSTTGQLVGVTATGEQVVTVSLNAVQAANGHDIDVTVTINQDKPLNHIDSGVDGLVDSVNDKITIDVPIQVQDTDGDWLDNPANVDITIKDGANPEFGTDSGTTIDEITQSGEIITGDVPLDVGSDAIHQLDFNADQPNLANLTSNGAATTFTVNGNVLTVVDSHDKPVMVVTIAKDGSYTVEVTGPIDQNDANIANINLGVTATDNDGDIANGQVVITINDGADAGGNEYGEITLTEGDLTPQAGEQGYPVSGNTTIVIEAGSDRLDPSKVTIDPVQLTKLISELESELTTGDNQAISFSYDSTTGQLVGVTADGEQVVTVSLDAVQAANGHDIDVTVTINQDKPLNHTDSGVDGLVDSVNDKITIDVPIQVQDTDGDWLDNPANVDITIVDGANPEFGTDSSTTIVETETGVTACGKIPLDVGSDDIAHIDFAQSQPSLDGIVSNNQATRYLVNGNEINVVIDGGTNDGEAVLTITISNDGHYSVEQHQPIEQDNAAGDSVNIELGVVATDDDGDSSNTGQLEIHIKDGLNPTGEGVQANITITEGDLIPQAGEQGYPVVGTGHFTVDATDDALVATSLTITDNVKTALLTELNGLTSGGDALTFSINIDANGVITITGITASGADEAVTITLTPTAQTNGDVSVEMTITQQLPLDHLSADGTYVDVNGGDLTINVPVQMQDTDGDALQQPVDVVVTIKDGATPVFGTDSGTTIVETETGTTTNGKIALDVGSDNIAHINFLGSQPSLDHLISNNQATRYVVNGNEINVVIDGGTNDGEAVLTITIGNDGSYIVEQHQPIEQDNAAGDSVNIELSVVATDDDGDSSNTGQLEIHIKDGLNPTGEGVQANITITESDLIPQAGEQGYPVVGTGHFTVDATDDALVTTSLTITDNVKTALLTELNGLTSGGDALTFSINIDVNGVITITGITASGADEAVTITLTPTAQTNGDVSVDMSIAQQLPLDHLSADGTYVDVNGGDLTINVPVQMQDTDGDALQQPVDVVVTIKDGATPVFGTDSGTTIVETETGTTTNGKIALDVGSDNIAHINFLGSQPSLDHLISNNQATRYVVNGNEINVVIDGGTNDGEAVLTITIGNDGSYIVEQHQPIEQDNAAGDSVNIELSVVATDDDGDSSNTGQLEIHIKDGLNPTGEGVQANITITEGDLIPQAGEQGYPVVGTGHFTVDATDDALVTTSLTITDNVKTALLTELNGLTSGGDALTFSINIDVNGVITITGITASGADEAVTITLTPTAQTNGDVSVDMSITQQLPLDHSSADGTYVDVNGGDLTINVPVQMQDTDGDALQQPVDVVVTIKDGATPEFGTDSSTTIVETETGVTACGKIPLDVGSDDIAHIDFAQSQPSLDGIVSNNQATRYLVNGNEINVVIDGGTNDGEAVLTITISNDGHYSVEQHQPIEQDNAAGDSVNIELGVVATDDDGDSSNTGQLEIHIKDGLNPTGEGVQANITITEGDLIPQAGEQGYPVVGTGHFTVDATDDALVATSLTITDNVKTALLTELNGLTSGGDALTFSINIDANGVITITGITASGADEAVTITLTPTAQTNGDVSVEMTITQQLPLDHSSADGTYVDVNGGDLTINVPVQMQDTDGDALQQPVDVVVTIKDGATPVFGTDSGTTIVETETGTTTNGKIALDVGSDNIAHINFLGSQPSLDHLISNNQATRYVVNGNEINVVIDGGTNDGEAVLTITIGNDGSYIVEQHQPIEQDNAAGDSVNIELSVVATDDDGDSSNTGQLEIHIKDGLNPTGEGVQANITITESDLIPQAGEQGYPVVGTGHFTVDATDDALVTTSLTITDNVKTALLTELNGLTSGGDALTFSINIDVNGVITITGITASGADEAVTITLTPTAQTNGDVSVDMSITQQLPLDHLSADGIYVDVNGGDLTINVPVQMQDTDGDALQQPVDVVVTIKDGATPEFGTDSGTTIVETETGTTTNGKIALDVGSDNIAHINFLGSQPSLDHLISNNQATRYVVNGNEINVVIDGGTNDGEAVLTITISNDGHYIVEQHQPIEQNNAAGDSVNIELSVVATDDDGDGSNTGQLEIHIKDGLNPTGEGVQANITITEGDLIPQAGEQGYPVVGTGHFTVDATDDALVATSLTITDNVKTALLTELNGLTSGGDALTFSINIDANGVITITGITASGADEAVTITLTPTAQTNGDVSVEMSITQQLPLDHLSADGIYVDVNGGDLTINVPVQMQDTDGDALQQPVDVVVTIKDGANPEFGTDKGTTIVETETGTTTNGKIALDIGSDNIAHINFLGSQPSLDHLISNNQATRYIVNGNEINVVIDGGTNDGEAVLTITISNNGHYIVEQHQPIEQNNAAGDSVNIELSVVATDDDGDISNTGQLEIHIKDGLNPTGEGVQANITITEGDLENPRPGKGYPVVGSGQFTVDATDDALVANSLTITDSVKSTLLTELNGLTSDGETLSFNVEIGANGVITITGVTAAGGHEAVLIMMTPSSLANGDVSVDMTIQQSLPLDHLHANGTFVDVRGGKITINVPVQMQDTDGDALEQPVGVNITIKDGQKPSFGQDTSATLDEGTSGQATGSGSINVDTGSDQIEQVYFGSEQASLNGLTSNGHATSYHLSADGTSVIIVLQSDPSQVVMEVSIDINGHYTATQQQPIDQVDNAIADNETIKLDVYAQDHDGDVSKPGQITINIHDGNNATGGETGSITITEGDLTPATGQQGYPVSGDVDIAVTAGVDRLDPTTVTIDNSKLTALINELQSELMANGAPVSFVYDHASGVLTGTANGQIVLTVTVTAIQAANGHDVDITVSITQHSPLDHNGSDNGGWVNIDGDKIVIDVPVQVKDTDGDYLGGDSDNYVNAQISINDGTAPVITAAPALTIEESDLASGSTPSGDGESALGDIVVNSGSDYISTYKVDVDSFNQQNDITSNGNKITLSQSSEGTYQGIANGNVVFTYYLLATGRYIFQLHGTIDHPTQGEDQLTIEIPVYAIDKDGDVSASVNINVTIKDDIPTVEDVALTAVESTPGHISDTNYGYVIDQTGADGAQVTSVTINGDKIALSDQNVSHDGYHQFDVYDGNLLLGQLFIKPDGQTIFRSSANLTHSQEEIIKQIGFEVTDGDGDTAQGTITIELSDQDTILHTENSIGEEDDGRHSTDPTDNVDPSRSGIAINMTIDGGDSDRGEHVGTVTIQPQAQAHGVFMYNGQPLTVNSDGSVTLPSEAFAVDNTNPPDVKFTLQGVTFVPDADYSTSAAGIKFDVTAQINTTDGGNHPVMNGEFSINVQGIADTPIWNASSVDHYVTSEDQDNVLLNVVADLQDTDGSESLFYFITVPLEYRDQCTLEIGGQLLVETSPGSGKYKVTVSQMASVEVNPIDNFSGDIKLIIQAQSKENSNFVDGHQFANSAEKTVIINVNPDADDGVLKVTRVEANEDQRIDLSSHITLTSLDDNTDGSEALYLQISALPEGAVLYVNDQLLTPNADGVYEISYQDLNGLSLQPPLDSNVDFNITVNGIVRDVVQLTDANGNVTTETSEKVIGPQTIDVALTGVVDRPEIVSDTPDWTPLADGKIGLQTTIKEDGEAKFDFKVVSGEHTNADGNTDGSETLSVVISDIPKGTEIYDAEGNLQTLVYAGEDSNGQPIYQVNLDSLTNIVIKPPQNSTEDISLDVRIVVTENDGASAGFNSELVIHITPEIDVGNYTTISTGKEDEATIVHWQPSLTDPQEHITGLALGGLPTGYQLFINGVELNTDTNGNVELTAQQLQALLDGGQLTVTAPHNSDQDIQLTSTVTVSQTDVDGNKETVTKDITGTLDVDIKAVVEPDGEIVVDYNNAPVTVIASGTDGVIDLSNDAGSDGKITWQNDDSSSSEVITQIVLNPIPEGFVIIGGINNGDGSWTVPQSALSGLKIIAPEGFKGELTLNINALVQDMSDDGDVSSKVNEKGTITLDFSANTESNAEKAADIVIDENYIVTGDEDHSIDLGQQMMDHIVKVSTAAGEQVQDEFTLVINVNDLPVGASISGAEFNHVTGEYVLKVAVGTDGSVDLSSIKLNLPADYAGDFKFNVTYVTTDTDSGDYKTQNDTIAVQVAPEVDGPSAVTITVVETEGLNADKQPISTSDDKQEQIYDNIAYEDGDIKLDLSMSLKDTDTSETDGRETIQSVTLTLANTSNGVFIDADGNVLGTSIIVDQSQLDNIHFKPALDFSGKVDINVSTTVVDTAIYDQTTGATVTDTKSFDSTVSFDVIAVNDEIKWQGIDTPIVGDEDTAIPLAEISGSLADVDGSEHIVSIKLENVPDGFIIEGAVNNGNGVWTITASGESFDLSSIKVQPPHDFSGNVDIDIVVYSQEASLDKPAENRETITIDVNPIADKVDTDVNPNASGDENSPITLDLGIKAYDDQKTINNPAINVHENGAESLQITITNVPDSSSFTLPDGVAGSAEKQPDGTWIIKVTGSDLDTLIFHPGDANNQTVINGNIWNGDLNLDIRAVDNGVIGTDSVAVDKTIHVEITPDNDAPVNHLPSEPLTVDEDATLVIKDLQVTDVDSNDHGAIMDMTVTLSVEHGQLAITAGADTSGLTITDNGDGKLIINGDLTLINQLLDQGINYTGDKDFNGTDSLTMTTDDNGNSGAGGALTDTDSINITVEPVNDAPINTVPVPFDVSEDSSHIITGLSIADVDAKESGSSGQMTVELNVEHGQLSIIAADTQGLTITDNGDGKLVISGDIDKINTLLDAGIEYSGDQNYNGSDQLTMTTSDNGNVGSGGTLTDVSTVDITVDAVNDAPVNDVPTTITASEDTATVVEGIKVTDADFNELANNEAMSVTLAVNHGSLSITLPTNSGVEVTGDDSGNVILKGSMADINAVLDSGVSYTAAENYSGSDELTITTNDGGNTGSGDNLSTTNKVNITVTPKADIPSLSLSSDHTQTAAIQSSLGTMVPLIGLIAAASADASETLTVKMSDLGSAQIVDKAGNVIGTDLGNGEWQITAQDLNDVYIKDLTQGTHTISVAAVSTESDGSQAMSPAVNINVTVDALSPTDNVIGQNNASDQANLVIDSTAQATLFGGDDDDILVGGLASDILVGGQGNDILWGGDLDGNGDGVKDIFLWSGSDFGTVNAPATDTIMDFEVGIDTINLGDALDSQHIQSLDDLNNRLNILEQQGNTEIQIFDDQHQVVQNIILNGVSHNDLFGNNAVSMSNEDKLDSLLNSGNLELSDNFGNQQANTLIADNQGESLFGFDGNDDLIAGQGNDILTGGHGDDIFTWHETSLSTVSNTDTITDFELDKDQINLHDLLTDDENANLQIDDLLSHVNADIDENGNVKLEVNSLEGQSQHIVLENINPQHDLGLADGASSADIVSSLFSHNAFQVDNTH